MKLTDLKGKNLNDIDEMLLDSYKDPEGSQLSVLQEILQISEKTAFGQKYSFNEIKTIEDYQEKVPLSEWHDYEEYVDLMLDGGENQLFPGRTKHFVMTSGTTGKNKYIPESELGALSKTVVGNLRYKAILDSAKKKGMTKLGHLMPLVNTGSVSYSKAGIPIGFSSGLTYDQANSNLRKLVAYPIKVTNLPDINDVNYLIMRYSLQWADMTAIFGNNAGRLKNLIDYAKIHQKELIEDIKNGTISEKINLPEDLREELLAELSPMAERAGYLQKLSDENKWSPANYWPELKLAIFWISGTVGEYVREIKNLLPKTTDYFCAGYGASECKFNIPSVPNKAGGALATFSAFYEFKEQETGEIFLAHQLEMGKTYEVILTTYAGLYRYLIGDLIEVVDFQEKTPVINFVGKSREVVNIANEKVYGSILQETMFSTAEELGTELTMVQVYPNIEERTYFCYVEFKEEIDIKEFEVLAEKNLVQKAVSYQRRRNDGSLKHLKAFLMPKGWQEKLYQEKVRSGMSISQVKLPVVIKEALKEYGEI